MPTLPAGCCAIRRSVAWPGPDRAARRGRHRGFTVTVAQLLAEKALWIPSLDVYVTAGDAPVPLDDHLRSLEARKGQRMLDRLRTEPEATLAQYTARWEDMGHPAYSNPQPRGPGHIVGLTWDSAIRKFGIDRGAGVWSDEGNPDKLRFWFAFGEMGKGIGASWKSQRLTDGLPVTDHDLRGGRASATRWSSSPIRCTARRRSGAATCRWCCCSS